MNERPGPFSETEVVWVAIEADRMARRIGHKFVLDDHLLGEYGFTQAEIDNIHARIAKEKADV